MKLSVLLADLEPAAVRGSADVEIAGIVCDSRQVRPGYLFAAVEGVQQDGGLYIEDALSRGAAAVLRSARPSFAGAPRGERQGAAHRPGSSLVLVDDVPEALGRMAAAFHGRPADRLKTIGITGTNGKTTTAYMVRALLQAAGQVTGAVTTVEYLIGARAIPASRTTPEAPVLQGLLAQMAAAGCGAVVMEVSSHALVQKRVSGVQFDAAVFTNLTRDHLDYHKTIEAYFDAKCLLFERLRGPGGSPVAVINVDDPWGARLVATRRPSATVLTTGFSEPADVRATGERMHGAGSAFRLSSPWGGVDMELPLPGRHNIANALGAIAACGGLGVGLDAMAEALARFPAVRGRLEEVRGAGRFRVFVDYAHTDDALENALATLRPLVRGRLIAVFGCGGNRDRSKRPLMGRVVERLADFAIVTSDNPRKEPPAQIIEDIRAGFTKPDAHEIVEDRGAAIRRALDLAGPGDVVLVAGKGHETFQEFADTTVPFDDRLTVLQYVAERKGGAAKRGGGHA